MWDNKQVNNGNDCTITVNIINAMIQIVHLKLLKWKILFYVYFTTVTKWKQRKHFLDKRWENSGTQILMKEKTHVLQMAKEVFQAEGNDTMGKFGSI